MNPKWKKAYKPRRGRSNAKAKVANVLSKPQQKAVAQIATKVQKKKIETKIINCPDANSGLFPTNTKNRQYLSASGLQYLVKDVYRMTASVNDSSAVNAGNRLGDEIMGVGFEMNYYFHLASNYTFSGLKLLIPFVKMRLIVFRSPFIAGTPNYGTLFDTNYLNVSTLTLQPIGWREGFVKDVLYDEVHILKPHDTYTVDNVSFPNTQQSVSNVFHFKKYFKYDKLIRIMDESQTDLNGTREPIHIAMTAEIDDSWSSGGFPPSDTILLYTTGYTRAWFKDA